MKQPFFEPYISYIEQHLFLELSLEECAKAAGYSPYHYCRVFNAAVGMTVKEYIRRRRVSEAAKMINETSLSLKEIAYHCGFNSQENFIRVFRSVFGITPNKYRSTRYSLHLLEPETLSVKNFRELDYSGFKEPDIVTLPSFQVAGKRNTTTFEREQHFQDVPLFWNRFYAEHIYEKSGYDRTRPRIDYGVTILEDFNTNLFEENNQRKGLDFDYLTGTKIIDSGAADSDMDIITIPSGLYAVFHHKPADDYNLIQNLIDTWRYIDYFWLPGSSYEHSGSCEFNEYDPALNRLSKSIYIPLKPKYTEQGGDGHERN
ncbi:MAG: AraC family transcriptional regulator [Lachnospiraceae bacterium]